ncbi:MAG: STT3 domain-containing protein [Candidatus Woesearchaeota archaeon]
MSEEKKTKTDKSSDNDDLEIDFSGIKKLFSGRNNKEKSEHSEMPVKTNSGGSFNEDIEINLSSIKKFFNNNKRNKIILTTILILIPVILTLFIRLQPQYLAATDNIAVSSVENYYKNMISQQVNAQYPNLPLAQRNKLVEEQWINFKKTNADQLEQQIKQTSEFFKTGFRYSENNKTYTFLGDLDSYYFLRQARNLNEKGMICDEIKEEKCIDNHMVAPIGTEVGITLHPYGIFYLYKFLNFFDSSINLMQAQYYLPTILAIIAAIAAFFIGRRLMNDVAGFFAAMFIATSPILLSRSLGADTDIWNIMFPLLIIWIIIESYEAKNSFLKYFFAGLAGLFTAFFNFAWGGWWYIFDFIIASFIGFLVFLAIKDYLKHKHLKNIFKEIKGTIFSFIIYFFSTFIFITLIYDVSTFLSAFTSPLELAGTLKIAAHSNLWPNVYTTVAELNEINLATAISQVSYGLKYLFVLSLFGILLLLIRKTPGLKEYILVVSSGILFLALTSQWGLTLNIKIYLILLSIPFLIALLFLLKEDIHKSVDIKISLIILLWYLGMIYASVKGVRFTLLLVPPFSISIGIAIGYIYQYLVLIGKNTLKINENISKAVSFILLLLILITPVQAGISVGRTYMPSMTKGWWDALSEIREKSAPDAIINSWWDFGHWFKYVADRRVTLDGASQNHPNAHWLGRALQTNDEKETIAILRMLDCGSNTFFEKINEKYNDTEKSQNVVKKAIMMEKDEAEKYLEELGFNPEIIKYSHCNPPENYFITSGDMVGKAAVWAHFGLWDFDRAYIINEVRPKKLSEAITILKERFNYTDSEATKIYYEVQALQTDRQMNDWIAPWPNYAGNTVKCEENNINNKTLNISINNTETIICRFNMGISNNGQVITVIDRAIVNKKEPEKTELIISFYDTTGRKLQETKGSFSELVIMDNKTKKYKSTNASISLGMLLSIDENNEQKTYTALIADPLLLDSTFTKLFFLNGKNMNQFEKFYDTTDITGTRIIVWKVKWE